MDDIATIPESASSTGTRILGSEGVHEFIRYTAASGIALALDIGVLWLLNTSGVSYLLAGALAFGVGLSTIYFLSVQWVFAERRMNPYAEFALFGLIGLVGLVLNEIVLWIFTGILGFYVLISKIASVVVVFSWNFAARKWLLFSSTRHE